MQLFLVLLSAFPIFCMQKKNNSNRGQTPDRRLKNVFCYNRIYICKFVNDLDIFLYFSLLKLVCHVFHALMRHDREMIQEHTTCYYSIIFSIQMEVCVRKVIKLLVMWEFFVVLLRFYERKCCKNRFHSQISALQDCVIFRTRQIITNFQELFKRSS